MKYDIAMKWVEALRSGKYEQGKTYLRYNNEFCCLGVLCDISKLSEWDKNEKFLYKETSLPEQVMQWSEIKTNNGYLHKTNLNLADLNDDGTSFKQIADIIEEHWEEL